MDRPFLHDERSNPPRIIRYPLSAIHNPQFTGVHYVMKRFKRIVVCIDRPEYDYRMVVYAGGRSRLAMAEEVHFLHVTTDAGPDSTEPPEEASEGARITRETLEALIAEHFKGHGAEKLVCEVLRGAPLMEVLRFAHEKDVDLIILGRHYGRAGDADDEALLARRITRKATCSVLVMPEDSPVEAEAIVVPVRDSQCSANALEVACGVAATTGATVTALNVYHVGGGYARVGTSLEEHQALLEAGAKRECGRLLEKVDTHSVKVECRCMPDLHGKPVPIILEVVAGAGLAAVVIGARGRTGAAGVLLGTVTEQLIRECPVPLLAVKKKGECIGILSALLTLAGQG